MPCRWPYAATVRQASSSRPSFGDLGRLGLARHDKLAGMRALLKAGYSARRYFITIYFRE